MLAVVVSRADSASVHVGEHLREAADWTAHEDTTRPDGEGGGAVYRLGPSAGDRSTGGDAAAVELREFDPLHLDLDGVGAAFGRVDGGPERDPDLLAFASRHAGETGPLLTAHHTGNLGPAEFGGEDRSLARACPNAHRRVLAALRERAPPDYEVGMECTHHGPSDVGVPSMFVEVGSDQPQWDDPDAAGAVAEAILALRDVPPDVPAEGDVRGGSDGESGADDGADGEGPDDGGAADGDRRHVVGFGGGHYAPRFERIARETDWAVGHVAADWGIEAMGDPTESRDVLRQLFEESAAARALIDGDRPDLEAAIDRMGYDVVGETWLRETTGVPLALAERLEAALSPVAEGLRFGDAAEEGDGGRFAVVRVGEQLLSAARAADREGVREAVEESTLAFETDQNGTRIDGLVAVAGRAAHEALVEGLMAALEGDHERVERVEGGVRVTERAFDPERARELGVPEGPAFGRLSAGDPVDVDGETVRPEQVHVGCERTLPVPSLDAGRWFGGDRDGDGPGPEA